jgi:hypothetical protein
MEPQYDIGDTMIIYLNGKAKMAKVFGVNLVGKIPIVTYHVTLVEPQAFVVSDNGSIQSTY